MTSVPGNPQLPIVSPTPQSMLPFGQSLRFPASVSVVVGANTDAAALGQVQGALRTAGITQLSQRDASASSPDPNALSVYLGGQSEGNAQSDAVLAQFGIATPAGLPSGGYVLAIGSQGNQQIAVLDGVDAVGTF